MKKVMAIIAVSISIVGCSPNIETHTQDEYAKMTIEDLKRLRSNLDNEIKKENDKMENMTIKELGEAKIGPASQESEKIRVAIKHKINEESGEKLREMFGNPFDQK